MMNSENSTVTYANLGQRVLARLFDLTINYLLQAFLLCIVAFLDVVGGIGLKWPNIAIVIVSMSVPLFYFWLLSANGRQTYGYRLAGLELQTVDGKPLSLGRALWRGIVLIASLFLWCCALLPALWSLIDKRKRTGYDYLCNTQVVAVRPARTIPLLATIGAAASLFVMVKADFIFPFPLRAYYLPSGSMENTLKANDRLLVNTQIYRWRAPQVGDIVVFKAPLEALLNSENPDADVDFVKRIVGTPGQKVEILKGQLFIDGRKVNEPYKKPLAKSQSNPMNVQYDYDMKIVEGIVFSRDYTSPNQPDIWVQNGVMASEADQKSITQAKTEAIPAGKFLALGDNRCNSNDSHVFGFVPIDSLRGRVMLRYWPLGQIKWFSNSKN